MIEHDPVYHALACVRDCTTDGQFIELRMNVEKLIHEARAAALKEAEQAVEKLDAPHELYRMAITDAMLAIRYLRAASVP